MIQNIDKITTNTGSVILWNNDSIIVSIPKGMYYCHMIDGIVKIKQIGVENIFNIVKTSTIDGETFPLVEDMLEKLSSFSRGGGNGEGVINLDYMVNTTHADLLTLVNNSGLTPGQQYRITDYVATVDTDMYNPDNVGFYARSNNHAFDIIVTADSVNKLNENARAIRHEGDTYFPSHTRFEVWKLKYTIFNDSERFTWALSTGKGVVYQLIDEFNNNIPYDFKSIQFQRNAGWVYTFGGATDASLEFENCFNNTVLNLEGYLNNNIFGIYCSFNTFGSKCHSNTFGSYCYFNTFGNGCLFNTFGNHCRSITFGEVCESNTFRNGHNNYNISNSISNIDFANQLSNFTTIPKNNPIEVIKTPTGVVMQQRISASETESFDVVI